MVNFSIKQKIWLMVGILGTCMLLQSGFSSYSTWQIKNEVLRFKTIDNPIMIKSYEAKIAVVEVQQWLSDISASRGLDGLDDGFSKANKSAEAFKDAINSLIILDPKQTTNYQNLLRAFDAYVETGTKMAKAYVKDGPAGGNILMGDFDITAEALIDHLTPIVDSAVEHSNKLVHSIESKEESTLQSTIALGVIAALFLIGALILAHHSIFKPINKVTSMAKHIAQGDADLSKRIEVHSKDEMGELAKWFNQYLGSIQNLLKSISESSVVLSQNAEVVTRISEQTKQGIDQQHTQTDMVATAMNEMSSTVQEVARNTVDAEQAAKEADHKAIDGKNVVTQSMKVINDMADEVDNAAESIQALKEDTESVGAILDVIKGVAEQTNLLALNAAIEAARAGEQGRGFAVVADEVRTLASRTQESTQEIQSMLERLQAGTDQAYHLMTKGKDQAKKSVEHSIKAVESLESIVSSVEVITSMNAQIASAVEEQSQVSEEINRNIVEISQVCSTTKSGASENYESSINLSQMAAQLEDMTTKMGNV